MFFASTSARQPSPLPIGNLPDLFANYHPVVHTRLGLASRIPRGEKPILEPTATVRDDVGLNQSVRPVSSGGLEPLKWTPPRV
jgi:hypothetical protein